MDIEAIDDEGSFCYNFRRMNYSAEQYKTFMRKTGIFNLLENRIIGSLVDYVTGVETGLDSNGRKKQRWTFNGRSRRIFYPESGI